MLNKNELFLRVYRKGKRVYHRNFILYYLPNGLAYNRLGIKAGKKLACAVRRNRVRRLVKEGYRLLEPELKNGYDLIFAAKEGSLAADSLAETMQALRRLLKTARLFAVSREPQKAASAEPDSSNQTQPPVGQDC